MEKDKYRQNLKLKQKEAEKSRKEDLDRLAAKRADEWNIKASQAAIVIKNAEESRKVHEKQRIFLKPKRDSGIRHVYVPAPVIQHEPNDKDITNVNTQCRVDSPAEAFNILL